MRYTAIHDFDTNDNAMGEAGFNSAGVGMSATETIYNGRAALAADPYVTKTGITEDAIESVILPVAQSRVRAPNYWETLLNKKARAKVSASRY
ncbi:pathogenicity island encoded protein: SPI3 [Salmonella enterica subsp. enterica]|uniref:Dipeptidase n=1 Tax=Salmonella enterica I TaxID=59201 RepID=A0A379WVV7_SALET|nr:pathogenicity island encoded protein: SPI3 [Salmonella enterica subsp. enterica]